MFYSRDVIERAKRELSEKLGDDIKENLDFLGSHIKNLYGRLTKGYNFQNLELDKLVVSVVNEIYWLIAASELMAGYSPKNKQAEMYQILMGDNKDLNRVIIRALIRDVQTHKHEWEESFRDGKKETPIGPYGYTFDEILKRERTILEFVQNYLSGLELVVLHKQPPIPIREI